MGIFLAESEFVLEAVAYHRIISRRTLRDNISSLLIKLPQPTMADNISNELQLITSQLSEKLGKLESEFQRWTDYKTDYDALEVQLKTLPETTSKSAMVQWTLGVKHRIHAYMFYT